EIWARIDTAGPRSNSGPKPAPATIYAKSQRACEHVRAATPEGVSFIDARPAFRRAAAKAPVHGPRDWNHPNELGYRTLGALVAEKLDQRTHDVCDDRWED